MGAGLKRARAAAKATRKNHAAGCKFKRSTVPSGDSVEFRWNLTSANGEIVTSGEGYTTAENRDAAIRIVMDTTRRTKVVSVAG